MKTIAFFPKRLAALTIAGLLALSANATITNALKIQLVNGSLTDETIVRFLPAATTGFDGSYDAYKIISVSATAPALFTNIDSTSHMSINALPQLSQRTDVDLYAYIRSAGTYTLQSVEIGSFGTGCKIVLEDKQTGASYPFRNGMAVSIYLPANTIATANRFTLHFTPAPEASVNTSRGGYVLRDADAGITADNSARASFKAFPQEGDMVIELQSEAPVNATIGVYSINGQLLYQYANAASTGLSERVPLPASGIYIVRSVIDDQVQSQKFSYTK